MRIERAEIVALLQTRGLSERADWVARQLPEQVDIEQNGSLLRMLGIDSAELLSRAGVAAQHG